MNRGPIALAAAFGALLMLAACGGGDSDVRYRDVGPGGFGHGGGGDREGPHRQNLNLFISPAGKPFRAPADAPYPVTVWFNAADADHDGKLTRAEFRQDAEAFFRELDADHDGIVDGFEVQAYEQKIAPEILPSVEGLAAGEGMDLSLGHGRGGRQRGDSSPEIGGRAARGAGAAGDQRPSGAGLYGLLNEPEPVAAADTAFNSKITLAEFLAAADRRFAVLDTRALGYLTLATLPKTPAQEVGERIAARRAAEAAKARQPASRP